MKGAAVKLADFGLAIEVQGDQQAWFGKKLDATIIKFLILFSALIPRRSLPAAVAAWENKKTLN